MIFSAEWTYLLTTRKVGGEDSVFSYARIKYGSNPTDTVTGTIIYPDDFSFSEAGVASMHFGRTAPVQINAADWAALEEAGCIFLPGLGIRTYNNTTGDIVYNESDIQNSIYHSTDANNASQIKIVQFYIYNTGTPSNSWGIYTSNNATRFICYAVRLAQDLPK